MKKKNYFIAKQFWVQGELCYAENEKVREILKEGKLSLHNISGDNIGELVDRLYEGGILKKLMPIILKPAHSHILKRMWNSIASSVTGVTGENVLEQMTDSQIASVMVDFFIFKAFWIQSLLGTTSDSGLSLSWNKRTKLQRLKKLFTISATEMSLKNN